MGGPFGGSKVVKPVPNFEKIQRFFPYFPRTRVHHIKYRMEILVLVKPVPNLERVRRGFPLVFHVRHIEHPIYALVVVKAVTNFERVYGVFHLF